jgi:hypothetical protein
MQIYIKSEKIVAYDVEPTWTIFQVKQEIMNRLGWPTSMQRLMYAGNILENKKSLRYYKIEKESTLNLLHDMKGGERMRIHVSCKQTTTGLREVLTSIDAGKRVSFNVEETWTISEVRISAERDDMPSIPAGIMLTYAGKVLEVSHARYYASTPCQSIPGSSTTER